MTISAPSTSGSPEPARGRRGRGPDLALVDEVQVWLEVNGVPAVTWMCTPDLLEELAVGWLHGEGYIETRGDLRSLRPCATSLGFWAEVNPDMVAAVQREDRTRVLASGCGAVAVFLADPATATPAPPRGAPPPPDALRTQILARAEGNPFFLEEILRHLIDEGGLVCDRGRWRVADALVRVELPDTVQAVLAARIDLLDAREKRTLQQASVVGRFFWPGAVAALLDDGADVAPALRRLERQGWVKAGWEDPEPAAREGRPRRRYYTVTAPGVEALAAARERFPFLAGLPAPAPT